MNPNSINITQWLIKKKKSVFEQIENSKKSKRKTF